MTAREQQDAREIGLPLPIGKIRTHEASRMYVRIVSAYGKSPDFAKLAEDWNNEVYKGIAAAVYCNSNYRREFWSIVSKEYNA